MTIRYHSVTPEIRVARDSNGAHTFTAKVLTYNILDDWGTVFAPGVFAEGLRTAKPAMLLNHSWEQPWGKVTSVRDTPEYLEVSGVFADMDYVPEARKAYGLMKDKIIDQFSVGFISEREEPDPNHRAARITKGALAEISLVLMGSVPGTSLIDVRQTPLVVAEPAAAGSAPAETTAGEPPAEDPAADLLRAVHAGELTLPEALEKLAALRPAVQTPPAPEVEPVEEPLDLDGELSKLDALLSTDE